MQFRKYHFWLLFFFVIFGFTFAMIIWTIKSASSVPVFEDKSFGKGYHDVDEDFNTMMIANHQFNQQYDTQISINEKSIGLEMQDIFFGQESLEKSKNRNLLQKGENRLVVKVMERQSGKVIENAKIHLILTRAIDDKHDIPLNEIAFMNGGYPTTFTIGVEGNWNITGDIEVEEQKGYLFVKTNTKK